MVSRRRTRALTECRREGRFVVRRRLVRRKARRVVQREARREKQLHVTMGTDSKDLRLLLQ